MFSCERDIVPVFSTPQGQLKTAWQWSLNRPVLGKNERIQKMRQLNFSNLSLPILQEILELKQKGAADYDWTLTDRISLTDEESLILGHITSGLRYYAAHLMNEATLWARAIYPLLQLAEKGDILASSEVPLNAAYPKFELHGLADGVLGKCVAGNIGSPYLVIVEAKRGVEGKNPQPQIYGEILASARLNQKENGGEIQKIFGCYTIADVWTFIRGMVSEMESDRPCLHITTTRTTDKKGKEEWAFSLSYPLSL